MTGARTGINVGRYLGLYHSLPHVGGIINLGLGLLFPNQHMLTNMFKYLNHTQSQHVTHTPLTDHTPPVWTVLTRAPIILSLLPERYSLSAADGIFFHPNKTSIGLLSFPPQTVDKHQRMTFAL